MSSTTPMRKSSRINTQPTSETHRYRAFSSASATADPQKAPSSARPPNTEILNAIRRHDLASPANPSGSQGQWRAGVRPAFEEAADIGDFPTSGRHRTEQLLDVAPP